MFRIGMCFRHLFVIGAFGILDQNKIIELFVVEIVEFHNTSAEGVLTVFGRMDLPIIVDNVRHHHRLLDEVGRVDNCVNVELLELFYLFDAVVVLFSLSGSSQVGIPRALVNRVAHLFAANTFGILLHLVLIFGTLLLVVLVFVF
jgi:hypothetical protein